MELKYYWRLFRRWLWLIIPVCVLAGLSSYVLAPTRYQASALIAVGDFLRSSSPDRTEVQTGIQLAETYAVIATTPDVVHPAAEAVGIQVSNLDGLVQASVIPDTSILVIAVTYEDPVLAASLSNEIARQITTSSRYSEVVEWAQIPEAPRSPTRSQMAVIGAALGLSLVSGAVLLRDYLDETIRTSEKVADLLEFPVLGAIPRFSKSPSADGWGQVDYGGPSDLVSEGYRALRINLLHAAGREDRKAFIITSPNPEEGKSATAANLAIAIAMADLQVLLIDADLRRPRLHELFDLPNESGLTTLLAAGPPDPPPALDCLEESSLLGECVQETEIPGLRVITSGGIPPNPTELLESSSMEKWVQAFQADTSIDVILLDTPPVGVGPDSLALAATTGVAVILLLRAGKTHRKSAADVRELFAQLEVDVRGVILTFVSTRDLSPHYKSYKRPYGSAEPSGQQNERPIAPTTDELEGNGE